MIEKTGSPAVHVWDLQELSLRAEDEYKNPYTAVDVWIDLEGPGFRKRIFGFWDGGKNFKVRYTLASPGRWRWASGSNQDDAGLNGLQGEIEALEWGEEEKKENPCRRGFIRSTENGHAFRFDDGTPFFYLADTWWAAGTFRYPWNDDDEPRPAGPGMGFKDMVLYRKELGYNGIGIIAAFPTWADDGLPATLVLKDGRNTSVRSAWRRNGLSGGAEDGSPAKDMYNEGGRPFSFPGKVPGYEQVVPDFNRPNPEYFKFLDRKIAWLNTQGFVPFIEAARRDVSQVWKNYYQWPETYGRYVQYFFARYHAYNAFLSPIHFDYGKNSIPSKEYNEAINWAVDKYGLPPFGNLISTNAGPSTLLNFGNEEDAGWLSFHQIGNWREHDHFWYLTEIFRTEPHLPGVNGEPYYPGFPDDDPPAASRDAELNCRSGMYGGFLSGGLGGYFYGAEGMWGGNIEEEARYKIWDALRLESGKQVPYFKDFVFCEGPRYQELIPDVELVTPNKSGGPMGYRGWAYCARTKQKDWALCYFEKDCPPATLRSLLPEADYSCRWFNPRDGRWIPEGRTLDLKTDDLGRVAVPEYPDNEDWAMSLKLSD
ncbi:DUF5060 domain-containing protein [Marispirochaeta aestuarii]|uniref:DUF5060 domain-containing protein n=1 Tax=Marispirochaeta aestuarii TaxID=1963862 RepID=UPI0029C675AB|nr:DUF5060 domain-containing protein [Marispirochaeta aestuarii]